MATTNNACNTIWTTWVTGNYQTSSTSDSCTVWSSWNTTTDSSTNAVWGYWNTDTVTYDNQYDHKVWVGWNEVYYQNEYPVIGAEPIRIKRTRSQRKAASRAKQRQVKADLKRKRKAAILRYQKQQAELKAQELLFDLLGEKQMEVFRRTGRLFVQGEKFGWLISMEGEGELAWVNIKKLKDNKIIDLCVRIDDPVPPSDKVISFALRAKFDEESFNKTANHTRVSDKSKLEECANF